MRIANAVYAWAGLLLRALSACPKGLAELITYGILHQQGYDSMTLERYVPINRRDFFAYKRKTIAEWYNQMRLFGLWEDE